MARKSTASRPKRSGSTRKASKAKSKPKAPARKKPTRAPATKRTGVAASASRKKVARKSAPASRTRSAKQELSPSEVLTRAEADVVTAIETLNQHMNSALSTFTELASAHHGRGKAVIRTAPLDRATATLQRLVAEVVEEQLIEMLPPLVDLRNEMTQRINGDSPEASGEADLCQRGSQMLDHVLTLAGARVYEARPGEVFDPLIHLATGESHRSDLGDGVVAEPIQPGFRSARGKVIVPAKVKVNRR